MFEIICGCVPVAFAIYGLAKFAWLSLFPISYDLQNQPLREAAFLAREVLSHDARKRDWRETFVGSIDEFNARDAA